MIKRLKSNATIFDKGCEEVLQPYSCRIREHLNAEYSLTMAVDKKNNNCQRGDIILAPTPKKNGAQAFRIYSVNKNMVNNEIEIEANHIFYDLRDNFIEDTRAVNLNGGTSIKKLLAGTQFSTNFIGFSDIEKINTAYWELMNPAEAILGDVENSFINRWGGEIDRDNFNIKIFEHLESKFPVDVRYSKNLLNCGLKIDETDVVTRIMPTGLKEDGQSILKIPEKYVDSNKINDWVTPKIRRIHYSNIKVGTDEGEYATEELAVEALRRAAKDEFAKGIDSAVAYGELSITDLSKMEEYKDIKQIEKIYPFDKIKVTMDDDKYAISKMVSYEFDCLSRKYLDIGFGTPNFPIFYK